MDKIAFLFAGQGSQYVGMTKDLYEEYDCVKDIYDSAEKTRPNTLKLMFEGEENDLKITKNTQPCLFLADLAAYEILKNKGINPDMVAGFSLGEIAALVSAGILSFKDGFSLVCERSRLMQEASEKVDGAMIAVLKMDTNELEVLCKQCGVYPVNYNCPGQIVVSGVKENIDSLIKLLEEKGVRYVVLNVSGAFHTPYMETAKEGLIKELSKNYEINFKKLDIYANLTAKPYEDNEKEIIDTVSNQVCNSVKWEETLRKMYDDGARIFIECGPGKTLSGFVKKTLKDVKILNVSDLKSLEIVMKEMGKDVKE